MGTVIISQSKEPHRNPWNIREGNPWIRLVCKWPHRLHQVHPFEDHPSHKAMIQVSEGKRKDWWKAESQILSLSGIAAADVRR